MRLNPASIKLLAASACVKKQRSTVYLKLCLLSAMIGSACCIICITTIANESRYLLSEAVPTSTLPSILFGRYT